MKMVIIGMANLTIKKNVFNCMYRNIRTTNYLFEQQTVEDVPTIFQFIIQLEREPEE
jgi:hypothetical protein